MAVVEVDHVQARADDVALLQVLFPMFPQVKSTLDSPFTSCHSPHAFQDLKSRIRFQYQKTKSLNSSYVLPKKIYFFISKETPTAERR